MHHGVRVDLLHVQHVLVELPDLVSKAGGRPTARLHAQPDNHGHALEHTHLQVGQVEAASHEVAGAA